MHNHPSGDPTPSRADVEMTRAIVEVARPLGIAVHDHIIFGKDGHASLKPERRAGTQGHATSFRFEGGVALRTPLRWVPGLVPLRSIRPGHETSPA
jgi:hypothetical protein